MEERILRRTGRAVSVIGLGTWQLGADWAEVAGAEALAAPCPRSRVSGGG